MSYLNCLIVVMIGILGFLLLRDVRTLDSNNMMAKDFDGQDQSAKEK